MLGVATQVLVIVTGIAAALADPAQQLTRRGGENGGRECDPSAGQRALIVEERARRILVEDELENDTTAAAELREHASDDVEPHGVCFVGRSRSAAGLIRLDR